MNKRLFSLMLVLALMLGLGSMVSAAATAISDPTSIVIEYNETAGNVDGVTVAADTYYVKVVGPDAMATNFPAEFDIVVEIINASDSKTAEHDTGIIETWKKGTVNGNYYATIAQNKIVSGSYKAKVTFVSKAASEVYTGTSQAVTSTAAKTFGTAVATDDEEETGTTHDPVAGIALNMGTTTLTVNPSITKIFYRFNKVENLHKPGKWKSLDVTNGEVNVSKLVTKAGYLEVVSASAPVNEDKATSYFKLADQPKAPTVKPKVNKNGYFADANGVFYATVDNMTTDYVFKRVTDKKVTPVTLAGDIFQYEVGVTATELHVMIPAVQASGSGTGQTGGDYTAASKPVKVKIAPLAKTPTVKVNYAKNVIAMKEGGMDVWNTSTNAWVNVTGDLFDDKAKGLPLNTENIKGANNIVKLRTALAKEGAKPGSASTQVVIMTANPELTSSSDLNKFMAIVDGKKLMSTSGSYAFEHLKEESWKKGLPKLNKDGTVTKTTVRLAAGGEFAAGAAVDMKYEGGKFYIGPVDGTLTECVGGPKINTTSTIANGDTSVEVTVTGSGFKTTATASDFTFDYGNTGLTNAAVSGTPTTASIKFTFTGTAKAGTLTITAKTSAFEPAASTTSNTLSIVVPASADPDTFKITFTTTALPAGLTGTGGKWTSADVSILKVASDTATEGDAFVSGTTELEAGTYHFYLTGTIEGSMNSDETPAPVAADNVEWYARKTVTIVDKAVTEVVAGDAWKIVGP